MPSKPLNSLNKSDQQDKKKIDIVKLILNKRKQETSNRKHAGAELLSEHSFSFIDYDYFLVSTAVTLRQTGLF